MTIDQEITVRRVLVLADARLGERCVAEGREALGEEAAGLGEAGVGKAAIAGVRVEGGAVAVEGELEAARFEVGKAVGPRGSVKSIQVGRFPGAKLGSPAGG